VPNGFVGSYYVVVITGGPFEFIYTGNNTFVSDSRVDITLTEPPDLTVTDVSVPETATEGMVIDVTWTVENMGQGGAEGFWFEAVTLRSVDTGAVIWLGEVQYATPLPAGLTYTRTEQFRLPGRVQGRYETVVTTNSRNTLYEHGQTGNNSLAGDVTMTLSVIPRPDLQVDNIIASTPVVAGSTMSVAFDVINQGAPTSAAVWTDRVYLSLDNKLSYDDTLVFSGINASALGTSELYRTTTPVFVVPKRLRGDMFVIVLTDATGAVDEWPNDNNNLRAQPLFVEAIPFADLVLSDVVGPQQAVEGSEIEVRYTVTNLGSGPTDRDRWSETVWLARDRNRPNPSHGDILLGRFTQDGALAVNAGYDRVVTVKLPGKVATGSYFITPWTDSYAEVLEDTLADNINPDDPNQIDNNNYKARPISVIGLPPPPPAPLPDLLLESLAVDAQAFGGGPFTVTWTTRNAGLGDRQGGWVDYILLSDQPLSDPFRPGWDTWALNPLGGYSQGGLHAGETRTTSVTFDLSPPVEGMFVTVVVDAHRRVAETDESNNVRGADTDVSIRPADLVISGVVTQPVSYSGERTTIQWTVTNVGDHEAWPGTAYWVDKVWLSPDPTFIADRAVVMGTVGHDNSDPLGPGESYTATLEAILPKGIGGDYYVYIAANEPHVANHASSTSSWPPSGGSNDLSRDRYYRKNAFESPYNNVNQAPLPVVYREPDLRVTDLSVPAAANAGQMVDVEFTVTNVGNRATREGMWYDRIFLSFDPTLDISDRWLGDYRRIGVLDINASYTVTLPARLPDSIEGEFYILAFADASQSFDTRVRSAIGVNQPGVGSAVYGNLVKEFQGEGNNITTAPLQVTQPQVPDLQVTAVTVPERVERGQSFDVAYTVTNFGGATPPTQREWIDLIYLSRDTSLDTMADRYLGVHRHEDGLAEDESYQVSRTFTMPTDLVGPWYVLVRTDAGRRVFEGDHENNNDRPSDPIIVELPPPADLVVTGIDVPTASRVGQPVHIQWTVANASDRSLLASWADTAYLSADATWDLGDRPLGRVPFVGNLLPGGSYTASLDAELPPVAPGQYRVIVRTDIFNQIFEDLNEANNRLASAGVIDIGVDALELGVPLDTTLSAGQQRMFQVTVPADQTLRVTLSSASKEATNELYLRHGDVPTSTVFDAAYQGALGADQIAVVPNTRPGEYFVLIRGFSVPEDDNPHGLYDLAVTNPDGEQAVVPYRFQVERAIEPEVTIGIGGPRAILAGDTGTFSVTLQGRSNLDAPYVFYRVGVPEMGPNPKIFGLPFVQFATNLRGTPESEELADVPWASLDSATNTTGHVSTSGYLLDQPALGFSGFSFNVATYPGLRELHDRAYVQLRNQLTALFPAFADLLTEDQASLAPWWNAVRDDFADRFPEYEGMMSATGYLEAFTKTLPVPKACLFPFIPFEFHVFAEATAMTHEEFMAHQRSEAERLRQAILVDENASSTLLVLAADAQVWGDLYIASIEQAGLLRPEGEAPPVREQAHLVSLLATLAGGILVGPAGSEIRTSGNLVEFFEQVRGWYGHDPDLLAPVEFYSLRKDACEGKDIYNLPVPALPDFEQADLGLSQPTHFETFRVYAPWIPFERRGGGLPPEFQIDFTTGGGLNALIQGGDGSTHPLDLSAYLEGGAESDRLASVTGPITGDSGGMVPMGHPLPYTIQFENPATASTHTAEIRVVTELDEDLDPHSFRLGDLEVGDIHVHIPQDRALFQGEFDFTEALGLVLRVSAGIDIDTRTATWLLEAIDPLTGELCRDPNKGLLPPNAELNQGAGFVSYTVRAKDDAATGAEVAAQARVLFNNAPPQDTLELIQVVDAVAPTTRLTVSQLSEQSDDYTVSWNVTDDVGGSGFRHVTIYVAVDGGDFRIWQRRVEASAGSEVFEGEAGHSYEFLALATDMAGNREPPTFGFTGPSDGSTVNLGAAPSRETTPPNFGIAPAPSPDPATNRLFLETEQGIPAAEPASRPPVFDVVLRPFVARSFATGIAQSNAGIGPMAIAEAPDDTIIISGGQKRSSLFRFDPEGGEATEPWVELEHPVFNLAFDDDGNLWATTGGGPLLQLDSETGAIVNSFGDGLTIALAIEPDTGLIYVSSGKGVEIFDPATQTFTHYSRDLDLRVGCLAFDDDGRLWATTWPDREQVIRFTERARAETILRFDSDIDSIAFGRAGTQLEGLLFVSHNTAPRLDTGEVTGGGSDLTMVDLATLRTIAVARGGSRGDVAVTTSDGRVLLSQSEQVDVLKPVIAPIVIATNPPPDAIVALPWPEVTVTFDTDMVAGDPDDPTSVINPANYVLAGDDTGPKPVLDARYDVDTRTLRLTFAALDAHGYELTVSGSVSSIDGQSMSQPHVTRFTAVSDLSALTDIEFVLARSDRGTDTVSYDVTITNIGPNDLLLPLILVLDPALGNMSAPQDTIGRAADGRWFLDLSGSLPADQRLEPGESTLGRTITIADGTTGVIVSHGEIHDATAVIVGSPDSELDRLASTYGLNVYPFLVTLPEDDGFRQLLVRLRDDHDITGADAGTIYVSSNEGVVTVTEGGRIQAVGSGEATVAVLHGPAEAHALVRVTTPRFGEVMIGEAGAIVQSTDGYAISVPPGGLSDETMVSVSGLVENELPLDVPADFAFVGAFDLDVGVERFAYPIQVTVPAGNLPAGESVYFFRYAEVPNAQGELEPSWILLDEGIVSNDGYIHTTSPPWPGLTTRGKVLVAESIPKVNTFKLKFNLPRALAQYGFFGVAGIMATLTSGAGQLGSPWRIVSTLDNRVANCGVYSLNAGFQQDLPKSVKEKIHLGATTAAINELIDLGCDIRTMNTLWQQGAPFQTYEVSLWFAKNIAPAFQQVVVYRQPGANVGTAIISAQPLSAIPNDPFIESVDFGIVDEEPFIELEGRDFLADPPAGAPPPNGSKISDLKIHFKQGSSDAIAKGQDVELLSQVGDKISIKVKVPKEVILGLSEIYIERPAPKNVSIGTNFTLSSVKSNSVRIYGSDSDLVFAGLYNGQVVAIEPPSSEQISDYNITVGGHVRELIDVKANDMAVPAIQTAVTSDRTRVYALVPGGVAVLDAMTLRQVDVNHLTPEMDIIKSPGGASSITVDPFNDLLYLAGSYKRIYVIDISPDSETFHKHVDTIVLKKESERDPKTPYTSEAWILHGMAVNADGRRLYVTEPRTMVYSGTKPWIDQSKPDETGRIVVVNIDPADKPKIAGSNPNQWREEIASFQAGMEPYKIVATDDPDKMLAISHVRGVTGIDGDLNTLEAMGLWALEVTNDAPESFDAHLGFIPLEHKTDWRISNFELDLHNAAGLAVTRDKGYAFVADYAYPFYSNPLSVRGAKIGIVKDPFGPNPSVVAVTTPIPFGFADSVALTADERLLYVSYRGVGDILVFDVNRLIEEINECLALPGQGLDELRNLRNAPIDVLDCGGNNATLPPLVRDGIHTGNLPTGLSVWTPGPLKIDSAPLGVIELIPPKFVPGIDSLDTIIRTRIDAVNGHVCTSGGDFTFVLNDRAKVSLYIDGDSSSGEPAQGVTNITDGQGPSNGVFQDVLLFPGKYRFILTASGKLSQPGRYSYTLVAVGDDGQVAKDTGWIDHDVEINSNLPLAHTIIKGVDIWDGHLIRTSQDVIVPGRGMSLDFTRTYSSLGSSSDSPMGAGWTFSYDVRLIAHSCGGLTVIGGEGTGNRFDGGGQSNAAKAALFGLPATAKFYDPQIGYHSTLVQPDPQSDPNSYDFYTKSHVRYHFELQPPSNPNSASSDKIYTLRFIEEPNGNRINLYYDTNDPAVKNLPGLLLPYVDSDPDTLDLIEESSGRALSWTTRQYSTRTRIRIVGKRTIRRTLPISSAGRGSRA